nr:hypothetical protein [Tanacetum cinerariifolium]
MHSLQSPIRPYPLIRMDHHRVPPLSPAYMPDIMELDKHVPVYVSKPEHPKYHAPLDDDIQIRWERMAMRIPRRILVRRMSPKMTMRIPKRIPMRSMSLRMRIQEEEPSEGSDETEPFEEDETTVTPPPPNHHGARISVRPQTPMVASTQELIDAFVAGSPLFLLPPTSPAYDQAPLVYVSKPEHPKYHAPLDDDIQVEDQPYVDDALPTAESPGYIADSDSMGEDGDEDPEEDPSHKTTMIYMRDDILEEDMPPQKRFILTAPLSGCDVAEGSAAARAPRGQYDFVNNVEAGQGLIRPRHYARTINRAADRAEDVGASYQAQVHRLESKYFYTQLHDAQTGRRDIRIEIDVVRGQRIAYETELQEVRQAYLSSEAQNRALLAQIKTLETHMSRMEWQRQSAKDLTVTKMMHIYALEARARTNTVEDAGSSC